MSKFGDDYKDSELNFGRLLVLEKNSKNTIAAIKKSVRSKYAKRLRHDAPNGAAICSLHWHIYNGFAIKTKQEDDEFYKIYQVDSDSASSLAALQLDGFVAAIEINASELKQLNNAIVNYIQIDRVTTDLISAAAHHRKYINKQEKQEDIDQVSVYTQQLEMLADNYGRDLLAGALATIDTILTSCW